MNITTKQVFEQEVNEHQNVDLPEAWQLLYPSVYLMATLRILHSFPSGQKSHLYFDPQLNVLGVCHP